MGNLSFKAEVLAGTHVDNAIEEAIWLAKRTGAVIEINFNGCLLRLHFCDEVAKKIKEYEEWLKQNALSNALSDLAIMVNEKGVVKGEGKGK